MNYLRKIRLLKIIILLAGLSSAIGFLLTALSSNINLFYTPTEILHHIGPIEKMIRVGGLVRDKSLYISENSLAKEFIITDYHENLNVKYEGILPDLFREGQSVVAFGTLNHENIFLAQRILAKHDEKYDPARITLK